MKQRVVKLTTIGILLIASAYLIKYLFLKYEIGVPCLFHEWTGLYCPGCGMTRAIFSLLRFDFYDAIRNNILILILIPFGIYLLIHYIQGYLKGKRWVMSEFIPEKVLVVLLIFILLFGVARNFDVFWFLQPLV